MTSKTIFEVHEFETYFLNLLYPLGVIKRSQRVNQL